MNNRITEAQMDESWADEEANKALEMEKIEKSLKRLEKKCDYALEKFEESRRNKKEKKKQKKNDQNICQPNRLARMELQPEATESSEVAAVKQKLYLAEAETEAKSLALELAKARVNEVREKKSVLRKKLNEMETRKHARWIKLEMARRAVDKTRPLVEEVERNIAQYQERLAKSEQENVKIRRKNMKLMIYQNEINKLKLENEALDKKIQSITERSQELKEICTELSSKEKAVMEKIDEHYRQSEEEEQIISETNSAYERKWTKINESMSYFDRLIEISNIEIQKLKGDPSLVSTGRPDTQEQELSSQERNESVNKVPEEQDHSLVCGSLTPLDDDTPAMVEEIILNDSPVYVEDITGYDSPVYVEDIIIHDSPASTEDIVHEIPSEPDECLIISSSQKSPDNFTSKPSAKPKGSSSVVEPKDETPLKL
ncbi:intracellular protein transport protein USO1-like [Penaeus japonicus]|uniref:intracellular protein transport protein USO1-like n=1 Tax=Penaeus japonicus TaxID=27405 RepID=UPI001C710F0C|nr:intracellular protein transport protein USO1-like [Penaeus japonicus]